MANASAEAQHLTTQQTVGKSLLDAARMPYALHKTALQHCVAADGKAIEKILAEKAAIDTEFRELREDMQAKIYSMQPSLHNEVKLTKPVDSGCVKLLVSKKSLNHHQQLSSADSQEIQDLKYSFDRAVTKERRSDTIIKSRREQLPSVRSNADEYRQRLPLYIERFRADGTDGFCDLLYNLDKEVNKSCQEAVQRH